MSKKMFNEPNALQDVRDFHELFDLPVPEFPIIPAKNRCQLRVNLIQEELDELKEAINDNDLVGIADALTDLQYVLSGAVLEFGLASRFKKLFDEVQRSNMSKACATFEEAEKTRTYYLEHKKTPSYIVEKNGEFLVYREEDKKVLKNIYYSEANLKDIVESDM